MLGFEVIGSGSYTLTDLPHLPCHSAQAPIFQLPVELAIYNDISGGLNLFGVSFGHFKCTATGTRYFRKTTA